MTWELVFELHADQADLEPLTDALLEHGALSVSVDDLLAGSEAEQPQFGEPGSDIHMRPWPVSRVRMLISDELEPQAWWQALTVALPVLAASPMQAHAVEESDWVSLSQSSFEPIVIRDVLWVGPHWHITPDAFRQPPRWHLSIDPGMAFGTGGHPTTQLCLEALLTIFSQPSASAPTQVLDLGCGSGILAIAAAKLGARHVLAVDIDPMALQTTRHNADINGVAAQLTVADARTPIPNSFDLVLANILAQPLKLLAPMILGAVASHGGLVLSGLLTRQEDEVRAAYAAIDPQQQNKMVSLGSRDGWLCLGFWPTGVQAPDSLSPLS
ncbi:MAG: 50S ribosomal protein L11 methyltransferase [Burkholderiaceae bacterium]